MWHSVCLACSSSNKQLRRPSCSPTRLHAVSSEHPCVPLRRLSKHQFGRPGYAGHTRGSARCPAALTRSLQRPNSRLKNLHLEMPVSLSTDTPATRTVLLWVCWLPPLGAKFFVFVSHLTIRRCTVASLNASQKCHLTLQACDLCISNISLFIK